MVVCGIALVLICYMCRSRKASNKVDPHMNAKKLKDESRFSAVKPSNISINPSNSNLNNNTNNNEETRPKQDDQRPPVPDSPVPSPSPDESNSNKNDEDNNANLKPEPNFNSVLKSVNELMPANKSLKQSEHYSRVCSSSSSSSSRFKR